MLLFGTGERALPPPPFLRSYLSKLGIQLDVMSTVRISFLSRPSFWPSSAGADVLCVRLALTPPSQRAACSTYNLLAEEGRAVAVALVSVKPVDVRKPGMA